MPQEINEVPLPILFLDIDDVLCLNTTFGGFDVISAARGVHPNPDDVYREVFDAGARAVLEGVHTAMEGRLRYVISSTWREVLTLDQLRVAFNRGGLGFVAEALHSQWCTPVALDRGMRADDIGLWLDNFHAGEAFAIVDDTFSGPSLKAALVRANHRFHGRVVLCEENVGLKPEHAEPLLAALRRPANPRAEGGR